MVDTVSPETIAKFASEELGMLSKNGTPLSAKLFRRNESVMELIKTFNEDAFIPKTVSGVKDVQFIGVNIPRFVKNYRNNPKVMTAMLIHHQEAHRALMDETIYLREQLNSMREQCAKLQEKLEAVEKQKEKLAIENKNISKFKNFQRDIEMLNSLVEKGYIDSISDKNIELAAKRTGVINVDSGNNKEEKTKAIGIESFKNENNIELNNKSSKTIKLDDVKANKAKMFWDNLNK